MKIINLTKPKDNVTMKNFNLLPYVSIWWHCDKRTFCVGWLNICIAFGYIGVVNPIKK